MIDALGTVGSIVLLVLAAALVVVLVYPPLAGKAEPLVQATRAPLGAAAALLAGVAAGILLGRRGGRPSSTLGDPFKPRPEPEPWTDPHAGDRLATDAERDAEIASLRELDDPVERAKRASESWRRPQGDDT